MTKIAQLHNGTQIHFPDETPDHEIDAAVHRHLGVAQPPSTASLMQLMQMLVEHANNTSVGNQKAQEDQHKTHVIALGAHSDSVNAAADKIAAAIGQLAEAINTVGSAVLNTVQQKTVAAPDGSGTMPGK